MHGSRPCGGHCATPFTLCLHTDPVRIEWFLSIYPSSHPSIHPSFNFPSHLSGRSDVPKLFHAGDPLQKPTDKIPKCVKKHWTVYLFKIGTLLTSVFTFMALKPKLMFAASDFFYFGQFLGFCCSGVFHRWAVCLFLWSLCRKPAHFALARLAGGAHQLDQWCQSSTSHTRFWLAGNHTIYYSF